ncbi:MAG: branched-chain amino acid ABC transporter substrate-binding protein [Phycicoccus sp.]|nr:branched-chain amino acid ABC transporter substrate-binding protein [Phycicoccus sp.]
MIGTSLVVASLALTACGSRDSDTGSDSASSGDKVVKIGVIAPLTGDLSALGLGIKNSVDLAIKEANDKGTIPGWTIELAAEDDEAKPDVGKNAATKLAGDDAVAGVVGTLNSSVALQTQPVLAAANIIQVSPANTNPALTKGDDGKRLYPTYFRTCTTDAVQGPFAAQYLLGAGITKVATVNDKKAYGQGLVTAFEAEFKKGGGEIVASETINADDTTKDYSAVIAALKPTAPQAVYYGGEYPQAGPLSQQMKTNGLTVPLMGGDGIYDGKYIELAGTGSDGDMATSVGAPTDSSDAGKAFLAAYEAAGYKEPAAAYGGYAYDAANSIIEALKTSLKDATDVKSAREAGVTAMSGVSFDGVTGAVGFDEFGDSTSKVLTVYKVTGGKWAPEKTDEFK